MARRGSPLRRIVFALILLAVVIALLPYGLTLLYASVNPISMPILARVITGQPVTRQWVPLSATAPVLPLAVLVAEDARFCQHNGVDWDSLKEAIDDAQDGEPLRGGSTITQQLAKNLFLWNGRSFVRKALELPLALWIDAVLSKRRILELYLNIAEWGPDGVFGAGAAARRAFHKPASRLSLREAAILASALPNPVTRDPAAPGPGQRSLAATYMARARAAPETADCIRAGASPPESGR